MNAPALVTYLNALRTIQRERVPNFQEWCFNVNLCNPLNPFTSTLVIVTPRLTRAAAVAQVPALQVGGVKTPVAVKMA
jgi:hypothetical protein